MPTAAMPTVFFHSPVGAQTWKCLILVLTLKKLINFLVNVFIRFEFSTLISDCQYYGNKDEIQPIESSTNKY